MTRGGDFGLSVQVMRDPIALGQRVTSGSFGWWRLRHEFLDSERRHAVDR
jgi:hypothetical protein